MQIQEDGSDIKIKENSSYTGASILFSISNNKVDYDIRVDLRDENVCNLNVYSEGEDIKTYFIDSANVSDYIKKIVSYKVVDSELLKKVQSVEFVQTVQSSNFVLSELESQKLIDAILKCEVIQADEINAGIPIVIKISENDYSNGKISPGGELVAIEQTVYDTSALEELKDHLKNIVK